MTIDHETAAPRRQWTDDDLDTALGHLQSAAAPSQALRAFPGLLPPPTPDSVSIPLRTRPRRRRPVLIAAAVTILAAGGLIIPTLPIFGRSVSSAAAAELIKAADAADHSARAAGQATPAGKYRYIEVDEWAAQMGDYSFLQQSRRQVWVPADWHDTWLVRRSTTGQRQWIHGTEQDAVAAGQPKDNVPSQEPDLHAPCARYPTDPSIDLCSGKGSWQEPTQSWIAALPTRSEGMYDRLYQDSKGSGQSQQSEMLVQATDALSTGLLPMSVAATLYRAMAKIGGVEVSNTAVNLDGQVGTGFTVNSPALRNETIIDPATGQYIGTRTSILVDDSVNHLPAGTVIDYTAVRTQIVDRLGATHP